MTRRGGRSCRHVELALPVGAGYETGDHVAVYPDNDPDLVEGIAERVDRPINWLIMDELSITVNYQ